MKKAVMYGAGNIGRGFIGQLFSESGYEVVFIDINPVVLEKLNQDGSYPVRIVTEGNYTEVNVKNVRAVSATDAEKVAYEIATCDIMATAVGVNVLPRIAKPIALGVQKRWELNGSKLLNIIICENLLDANHYLAKLIKQELSESEIEKFNSEIGLVEASIGRMVPVMTTEMQEGNPLRVWVEPYSQLPVDKAAFKGEIPQIKNMVPFAPFDFYIQRKLFMHNMGHATTAYLGYLNDCTFIWEAVKNPNVKLIALRALQESAAAMSKEHDVPLVQLLEHSEDLIYRFSNKLLGDTVERVGKDPIRKLNENDRLIGAAKLCIKQGIKPINICIGIAAAFVFAPASDEFAAKVQDEIKEFGLVHAIKTFCGIVEKNEIVEYVETFYKMLKAEVSFDTLTEKAELLKNK